MNIGNSIRLIALGCGAFVMTSCASIVSGRSQEVSFRSSPEGATVTVGGRIIGMTPVTTMLLKKSGQIITFEKEGYQTLTMNLEMRMDGWFWGNIVLGGLIGSTTDGVTGAVHEYSPSQYMVVLDRLGANKANSHTTRSKNQKATEFIVVNYRSLIKDISSGKGEYLKSLFILLEVPKAEQPEAIKKIRSLSEVYTDAAKFADSVVQLFMK